MKISQVIKEVAVVIEIKKIEMDRKFLRKKDLNFLTKHTYKNLII